MNTIILTAFVGAIFFEFMHWYELKTDPNNPQWKLLTNPKYIIPTISMILIASFGTYYLFGEDVAENTPLQFLLGAAFPQVIKKLVAALINKVSAPPQSTASLMANGPDFRVRDYFR